MLEGSTVLITNLGTTWFLTRDRALSEPLGVLRQETRDKRRERERERERQGPRRETEGVVSAKVNKYIHIAYISFVRPKKGI